jgi:tetratricopeptide (TPR) repeat protein
MLARGPSGIGKSALLRRFLDELRERHPETVILQGRCYERESVPYKALDAVLDALARHLKRLPEVEAAALLPREASALERLFPVLRRVFEQRPVARAALDPAELRRRGAQALRELLARLGDRHPVVVCIDDLQWGDADSAALLADLVAGPDAPALLWLAFVREEEATTSPLLGKLAQLRQSLLRDVEVRELRLGPLAGDEVRQLAAVLLEEAHGDGARAEAIAGESGGSPFFLQELARGGGGDVGELVLRRARALPPAARGLLEVIAVAARPIELVHVLATAGGGAAIPAEELRDALARLRAERLIRGRENELVECYHDRIRDPVTRAIEPERLRAIHLTLAAALEGRADAAQIAEHYAEGGDGTRALAWMVRGAEAAAASLAIDEAVRLYRRALQLAGEARDVELELAAAEAASAAGHGVEAAQLWLGALDRVAEPRRLELQRRAGDDLLLAGRFDEGWAAMGAVLAELGVSVPRSVGGAIARVLWGRAQRAIFGRRFRASAQPVDARVRARLDAIVSIEQSAWLVDPIRAAAIQAQYLPLALQSGDPTHAAAAMLMEALASSSEGTRASKKTHALLSEARLLSDSAFGGSLEAIVAVIVGTVAMMEGRFADAHRELERAAELDPSSWPGHGSVRMILSMVQLINLFWLGRAGEAMALVPLELRRAEERSNLTGWAWIKVIEGWALGLRGRVAAAIAAEDEVLARVPARGFELPRWYLDYNRIMHALEEGDGERAWSAVTAARKRDRFAISSQSQSVYALRVGAAAALAHAGQKPAARTAMLAEVRQFVASIEGKGAPWAEGIARALQAAAVSVAGDGERARRLLHEAEPLLSAHRQELMLAAVRAALGRGGEWSASEGVSREALWAQLPGAWRLE